MEVIHCRKKGSVCVSSKKLFGSFPWGSPNGKIARSCSIAQSTVHEYLKAAAEAGVSWPLPAEWNEPQLEGALSRKPRPGAKTRQAAQPDFPAIRRQLQAHRNLTLQLLWEEYREGNPADGYSYSRFCELYHDWARTLDVVLRHDHRAGEKMFVDYAGDKIPIHDRQTGEVIYHASLFVAVPSGDPLEPTWIMGVSVGPGLITLLGCRGWPAQRSNSGRRRPKLPSSPNMRRSPECPSAMPQIRRG